MNYELNRSESSAMRGLAILGIILHNYTHWLGPMVKENEYTFSIHNVRRLMMELAHPSWDIIAHLLSFFGHYGVPVFLFLSAYGLVMKYESTTKTINGNNIPSKDGTDSSSESAFSWIFKHYKKLFLMMVTGYAAFVMVDYMTPGPRHYEFWNVVGQLGMFSNLYADPDHDIWPGPYWYFGLMVQIYIVYRLLFYRGSGSLCGKLSNRNGNILLGIVTIGLLAGQMFFEPEGMALNWYRYNVFGAVLPFALGLVYARAVKSEGREKSLLYLLLSRSNRSTMLGVCILMAFLIFACSMNFYLWAIVPAFVCVFTVLVVKLLPQGLLQRFAWVGGISAAMFVSHPIARKIIIPISRQGDLYAGLLLYFVAAIILGILFRAVIKKVREA